MTTTSRLLRRRLAAWVLGTAALLLALYAGLGFVLLPWLAQRELPRLLGEKLNADVAIGRLRLNPFTLQLEAGALALNPRTAPGSGPEPALAVRQLTARLDAGPLWHGTWSIGRLSLDGVRVRAEIAPDGRLNLLGLVPPARPDAQPGAALRLALRDASLADAWVVFIDHRPRQPARAEIGPIEARLTDFITWPGGPAHFRVGLALPQQGRLSGEGTFAAEPLRLQGRVQLDHLDAALLWPFVAERLPHLQAPQGVLDASTRFDIALRDGRPAVQLDAAALDLHGVRLQAEGAAAPLLQLGRLEASGGRLDLGARQLGLGRLAIDDAALAAQLEGGVPADWLRALAMPAAAPVQPAPPAAAADGPGWQLQIDQLALQRLGLQAQDRDRALAVAVRALALNARVRVAAGVELSNLSADVQGVSVQPAGAAAPLTLASLTVRDGQLDTTRRLLHLGAVEAEGGAVRLQRKADGTLALLPTAPAAKAPAGPAAAPWAYAVDRLALRRWQLGWRDDGFAPPLQVGATLAEASLQGLDSRSKAPAALRLQLKSDAGGQATLQARLGLAPLRLDGQLALDGLALAPLQPVLSRHAALKLKSGALSGRLRLQYAAAEAGPTIAARGELSLGPTVLAETATGDRLLAWQSLQARGLAFDSAPARPARLGLGSIELLQPAAKLAISAARQVNVMQVLKAGPDTGRPRQPASPQPAAADVQPPLQLRIGRIALRGGEVDYADLSLVLPFATRIERLDGAIVGLANDGRRRAQVEAHGEIPPFGAASVEGSLLPFAPTEFMDLRVKMDNVAIPPLSPYTATFAGRTVKSGKLWLDLAYKIDHQQLLGDNQVRLADFTLGERVQARSALDLPLDLAVALLTDENGRIDLAVPVRGDLGHPSFQLGPVIRQAIGDILGRVVSAPFRALARLFGGNSEKLASVLFEPGRAGVAPPEREKLQQLAQALQQRPGLRLVVPAPYAEADRAALREQALRRDLAQRLGQSPAPDAEPEPIDWASRRAQRALLAAQPPSAKPPSLPSGQDGAEAYRALFEQTAQRYPLADDALQQLASRRAAAMRDQLLQQPGVAADRLQTAAPALAPLEGDDVAGRMAFGASR